jgi:hypothetical protein
MKRALCFRNSLYYVPCSPTVESMGLHCPGIPRSVDHYASVRRFSSPTEGRTAKPARYSTPEIDSVLIISAFKHALKDALEIIDEVSLPVDIEDDKAMYQLISSSIGTKFVSRWSELMCNLALKAVRTVTFDIGGGKKEVDIKRYARVEKVPGGEIEDSRL